MPSEIIRSPEGLGELFKTLSKRKMPITLSWVAGADRTDEQNSTQWLWAAEAAMQLGDREPADVQAMWKLEIGVPILRADDVDFRDLYDTAIRPLDYERKIKLMKMGFAVTSRMKVRQMVRYMDGVERQCIEQGLKLTPPDPELSKYHARYREKEKVDA